MRIIKGCVLMILCVSSIQLRAQVVDNTATFNNISNDRYFRFTYDNDYFTKMDYYYSQGLNFEYVHPAIRKFPLTKLLLTLPHSEIKYGLALDHSAYTPTSITSNSILYGDRPYSAAITLKTFSIATDADRKIHLSSAFTIGILGPAAFGEQMQTGIHRWLKNVLPLGWQYQVKNDAIVNYQLNYEKRLLAYGNYFQLSSAAEARIGTLNDKLSAGFTFMAGHFNDPYQYNAVTKAANSRRWRFYFYGHPQVSFVGYDATLQGGLFNRKSPYTISSGDLSRVTLQADAGFVLTTRKIYLSYCQSILTREFSTGEYHRWGGVRLGLIF